MRAFLVPFFFVFLRAAEASTHKAQMGVHKKVEEKKPATTPTDIGSAKLTIEFIEVMRATTATVPIAISVHTLVFKVRVKD